MNPKQTPGLLTPHDLARLCAVSLRTIWRWIDKGKLPEPLRLSSNTVRWRQADIDAWLEKHRRKD